MKNKDKKADKWLLTFNHLDFKDDELCGVLEDMLDSKILKYGAFQRFSSRSQKEHIVLFIVLNEIVDIETLQNRFHADCFEIFKGNIRDCRNYVLRRTYYSCILYEIGSLEEDRKEQAETINIKGVNYTFCFVDDLQNACGVTYRDKKKILVTDCDDLFELKKRIVHELLHAYLDECGLSNYCSDETLVTWLDFHFTELNNQTENLLKRRK